MTSERSAKSSVLSEGDMNSDAEMLQAMEHLADQIDRLAAMLDECVTLTRAGVPISARVDRSVCRASLSAISIAFPSDGIRM